MMGGRAAEHLILNEITTGASNDIERATSIARRMVCEWGMSDELGPMAFGKKNEEIFLGREIQSHRDYSEETAQKIDHEVVSIIKNAQETAHKILEDNISLLHLMAEELLEHETIDGNDIKVMMNGKKISRT
jgi:cell division protease FtsH